MTWTAIRWVWRLEAPLFIGMLPAGVLNRCRLYVPARVMHGAVTAELARLNFDGDKKLQHADKKQNEFPDYGKFGREVGLNCRFSYLYPAEKKANEFIVWLPEYKGNKGLCWNSYDGKGKKGLLDRDFRRHLLDSRSGTAITPETNSGSDGTLRETECINPNWRGFPDEGGGSGPVFFVGYVFLKNNSFNGRSQKKNENYYAPPRLRDIRTLFVGGDIRYGFGKMRCVEWQRLSGDPRVFGRSVRLDKENPEIKSDIVWGHVLEDSTKDQVPIKRMQGMKELLGGWEIDRLCQQRPVWVPGSVFGTNGGKQWLIDNYGFWVSSQA